MRRLRLVKLYAFSWLTETPFKQLPLGHRKSPIHAGSMALRELSLGHQKTRIGAGCDAT